MKQLSNFVFLPRKPHNPYCHKISRPSFYPSKDSDASKVTKFMGYSIVSSQYRLTKWVKFNRIKMEAQWDHVVAVELYNHILDPLETKNIAELHLDIVDKLSNPLYKHFSDE